MYTTPYFRVTLDFATVFAPHGIQYAHDGRGTYTCSGASTSNFDNILPKVTGGSMIVLPSGSNQVIDASYRNIINLMHTRKALPTTINNLVAGSSNSFGRLVLAHVAHAISISTPSGLTNIFPVEGLTLVTRQYPSVAITSHSMNVSGAPYGNGMHIVSASTQYSTTDETSWMAFDNNTTSNWTAGGQFYNSGTGTYNGYSYTTLSNGSTYAGEWIQINFPKAFAPKEYLIGTRFNDVNRGPKDFILLGSNNGVLWDTVDTQTNITGYVAHVNKTFVVPTSITNSYSMYRLCINKNNGSTWMGISSFVIRGNELDSITDSDVRIAKGIKSILDLMATQQFIIDYIKKVTPNRLSSSEGVFTFVPSNDDPDIFIKTVLDLHVNYTRGQMAQVAGMDNVPIIIHLTTNKIPMNGMIGWYDGDSWVASSKVWADKSPCGNHVTNVNGTINYTENGINGHSFLSGGTTAKISFPLGILPDNYTLFHVCRYNGATKRRIFSRLYDTYGTDWLSGFHVGRSGIAFHNTWITNTDAPDTLAYHVDDWVLSTDQPNEYRSQGKSRRNGVAATVNGIPISINGGSAGLETSDWACAAVIIYDRLLTPDEIITVEKYLEGKYGLCVSYPPEPLNATGSVTLTGCGYGNGTYTTSASSRFAHDATYDAYAAFNNKLGRWWHSTAGVYNPAYLGSNYIYPDYMGEWIRIDLPYRITLKNYQIAPRDGLLNRAPCNFRLYACNPGTSWVQIDDQVNVTGWTHAFRTFTLPNNNQSYQNYVMVINTIVSGSDSVQLSWRLFGDRYFDTYPRTYTNNAVVLPYPFNPNPLAPYDPTAQYLWTSTSQPIGTMNFQFQVFNPYPFRTVCTWYVVVDDNIKSVSRNGIQIYNTQFGVYGQVISREIILERGTNLIEFQAQNVAGGAHIAYVLQNNADGAILAKSTFDTLFYQ